MTGSSITAGTVNPILGQTSVNIDPPTGAVGAPSAASAYGPLANYFASMTVDDHGRWMMTVGTPQPDPFFGIFTAATPSLIPGQPWNQDSSFMIAGTYTIPNEYANTFAVTCYVKAANADINAVAGTVRGEIANGGGAGLMGMGIAMVPGSIGHGAELEADAFCANAGSTAAVFLLAGGDGIHPVGRYINMRSGATGNSPMAGILFDGSTGINPVNNGGALLRCVGNVATDYGMDLRGAILNVPFASNGFLVGSSGQVRLGNTGAVFDGSEQLSVAGPVGVYNGGGAPVLNIGNQSVGGVTNMGIYAWNGAAWYMVSAIWNDGVLGHFGIPSDYRLKHDIKPRQGGWSLLSKLKVREFCYDHAPKSVRSGFLAHEVQEVFPEAVMGEKDATTMQNMAPAVLIPDMVLAIQQFNKENRLLWCAVALLSALVMFREGNQLGFW